MIKDIESYIPLIKSIAEKYLFTGIPMEDLIQEGLIGVIEAKKHFDQGRDVKFSTYSVFWIKKYILQAVGNEKKIPINYNEPEHLSEPIAPINKEPITFPEELEEVELKVLNYLYNDGMSLKEISSIMNITREKVRQIKQKALRRIKSLEYDFKSNVTI
ncbi:MAG: sigma-70 family RNA polymerase sigma factor [Candidatus Cloacimonetes bacterium]|nr:sigma-70 family RNA polymerase sigma factor [Candidatus Cloacimonadota bacterium]